MIDNVENYGQHTLTNNIHIRLFFQGCQTEIPAQRQSSEYPWHVGRLFPWRLASETQTSEAVQEEIGKLH